MKLFHIIVVTIALGILGFMAWDVHKVLVSTNALIAETQTRTKFTDQLVNANLLQTSIVLGRIEVASRDLPKMKTQVMATMAHADQVVVSLNGTIKSLDNTVQSLSQDSNEVLASVLKTVDAATNTLQSSNTAIQNLDKEARPVLEAAVRSTDAVTDTVHHVDGLVDGVKPIEDNLTETSKYVASTSKHADASAEEVQDILGYIRDDFKPTKKSFWVRLADLATNGFFSLTLHLVPQNVHETK